MEKVRPARVLDFGINSDSKTGAIMVNKGDTLWNISQRYRLPLRSIIDLNNLEPPYNLSNGQRLRMPAPVDYKVRSEDTLYSLSQLFDVSIYQLAKTNNLSVPYRLTSGQYLRIPSKYEQYDEDYQQRTVVASVAKVEKTPLNEKMYENREVYSDTDTTDPSQKFDTSFVERLRISEPIERPKNIVLTSSKNQRFTWPVKGKVISGYGAKDDGLYNEGINIAVPKGAPITASSDGVVAYVGGDLKSYGNLVLIKHGGGITTAYAHLDKIKVKKGQKVGKNQIIGSAGSTGSVASSQLHFEIRKGSKTYDPKKYL